MKTSAFWQRVRALIKEKKVSQAVVAQACGVPFSTFKRWINRNMIPPLDVASELSKYFGTSLDYLTFGKKEDLTSKIGDILNSLQKANEKQKTILQKYSGRGGSYLKTR